MSEKEKLKLHIGCGPRVIDGWVNIDKAPTACSEVLITQVPPIPFENESIVAIYSEDFFEHLDQREQLEFLAECLRVLVNGGWCRIVCPDLGFTMRDSHWEKGQNGVADTWHWGHKLVPTKQYLVEVSTMVGFKVSHAVESLCPDMPKDLNSRRGVSETIHLDLRKP